MTLLWVHTKNGLLRARCGPACHSGRKPAGRCCCLEHARGVWLAHGIDQVREHLRDIKKAARSRWGKDCRITVNPEVWQPSLPFPELAH